MHSLVCGDLILWYFDYIFFCNYYYSIHFGSTFWLTNKFHFLTGVIWYALCSVCQLTVDGWREHIVLWKWFTRNGEISYQWNIWGNYFSWQSLSCLWRIAWTMPMKLNICNVFCVVEYKTIPIWHNHLCFFNSIDWNFYQYNWGIQDPYKGEGVDWKGGWNIKGG